MSQEIGQSGEGERKTLPIEKGFPIERVNEIVQKEGRAKRWYRPIYTMHKWWARRTGAVFRTICLYSLLDDPEKVEINQSGQNETLASFHGNQSQISDLIETVNLSNPESLWQLYPKDVTIKDKKVLDPFMGGGTSVVEASRFGVDTVGNDLNPVAWFVSKKELDAGESDISKLEESFAEVRNNVAEELQEYYKTPCPNGDHEADVMYYFWVKELDCVSCDSTVPLYRDYRVGKGRYEDKGKYNVICPSCEEVVLADDWKEETTCSNCKFDFTPSEGNIDYGKYICPDCGQKYSVIEAIEEQGGYRTRLHGLEYHCSTCDEEGAKKGDTKGYKATTEEDIELFEEAKKEWEQSEDLNSYVPDKQIRPGWKTAANEFEGSMPGNGNLWKHGYTNWTDLYNERQLLCLSKLLKEIDNIEDQDAKEFLLLAFSHSLRTNTMLTTYTPTNNVINQVFKTNSFDPPMRPAEGNPWGAEYGYSTFKASWKGVLEGIEWAKEPFEKYVADGETKEATNFSTPVGENSRVRCGDARNIQEENEFDAIITDPPYYNNVLYSELSDLFYVWQKIVLESEYEWFEPEHTPRAESIVVNPASNKEAEEFESEMRQAFDRMNKALKSDGVLAFTYHHSDSESWGELLEALCDVGFEVTATYPISADINKFSDGEMVSFDIVIIARPSGERTSRSWNSLRREIYRTAQKTRNSLEENRNLSRGDIGVVEMGRCFHEYSKHHGKVERAGETMTAKEVVDEIYGVIQHGSDIGEIDVFLDLQETSDASYNDLNKLCRGTNATPEHMEDMHLYRMDDGFKLGTWNDEKRIAYIQSRVDSDEELTDLDKAQFLRYRWEHGKSVSEYLGEWEITDDLRELCEGLADATGDDTYRNILESRLSDY